MYKSLFIITLFLSAAKFNAQWIDLDNNNFTVTYYNPYVFASDQLGNVFVAGCSTNTNTAGNCRVHKWDGVSWSSLPNLIGTNPSDAINGVYCANNYVYITSSCIDSSGETYLARWDGNSWANLGNPKPGENANLEIICSDLNGNIFIYGRNGQNNPFFARYNSGTWAILPLPAGLSSTTGAVGSMCSDTLGNLYAAGSFTNSSGNRYVAKWNGINWTELGGQNALGANQDIYSIRFDYHGNLYAGGYFSNTNNELYVAKWDGTNWNALPGLSKTKGDTRFIFGITSDLYGNIYAGGILESLSTGNFFVGKWNGNEWVEINTNFSALIPNITSLCADPAGNLYAAGDIRNSSGNRYVAMYPNAKSVGINEQVYSNKDFKIYPNPTSDFISIQATSALFSNKNITLQILNIAGVEVVNKIICEEDLKESKIKLDLSNFEKGIYFLGIFSDGKFTATQKILKE